MEAKLWQLIANQHAVTHKNSAIKKIVPLYFPR
jgi:hypothetical protein